MSASFAYYNENDNFAVEWLRALIAAGHIADGEVDSRPIQEVDVDDLNGFTQHHFFAGIGVWSYALRKARWPDSRSVWTGSCPCQPFSSASRGRGKGFASDKHLWPSWETLIAAKRPGTLFGEQVASAGDWFDTVCDDLEALGYEIGAAIIPALSIGQNHARPRIYFIGNTYSNGQPVLSVDAEVAGVSGNRSVAAELVPTYDTATRLALMRGFGNAIVAEVATAFIEAYLDIERGIA